MNNIEMHAGVCDELSKIYEAKNKDYGDSFTKSFDKFGMVMPLIRLEDKLNRLESLVINGEARVHGESMIDTLMDLANYAIMTIMVLDKEEKV
jgi:hypothetical protein